MELKNPGSDLRRVILAWCDHEEGKMVKQVPLGTRDSNEHSLSRWGEESPLNKICKALGRSKFIKSGAEPTKAYETAAIDDLADRLYPKETPRGRLPPASRRAALASQGNRGEQASDVPPLPLNRRFLV